MKVLSDDELTGILSERLNRGTRQTLHIEGFRQAAVLVPLIGGEREVSLLFTRRTDSVETHKGQISFPGGMVEEGDADMIQTALREAHEEVGIAADTVRPLGLLDDIATPIGFVITPVVGFLPSRPILNINDGEVAEVFDMPLSFFTDSRNGRQEFREVKGRRYEVWHYDTGKHVIWGATAKIVRLLLDKLEPLDGLQK